jgi:hypothetical protein
MSDFVGTPEKIDVSLRGIAGTSTSTYKGTVRWAFEDDQGVVHTWDIPDTYYNKGTPF